MNIPPHVQQPVVVDLGFTIDELRDESSLMPCVEALKAYDYCYIGGQMFALNPPIDPAEVRERLTPVSGPNFRLGLFSEMSVEVSPEEAAAMMAGQN